MLKKTITYTDYNGSERTEDFYFNFSKAELAERQLAKEGGMDEYLRRIVATQDAVELSKYYKEFILKAYGEKSPDGRRFVKSEEISKAFSETEAYSQLYIELATNEQEFIDFVNGVIPDIKLNEATPNK